MKFLWPWEVSEGLEKVLLPVLLSICGNTVNGLGYIIQKVAHNRRRKAGREESSGTFCKDPVWLCGFMVYATGSLLHATALAYGSESLLQPMESFTLITNAILAPTFLDEEVNRSDMLSIGIIIIGVTFTVLFGPRNSLQPPTKEVFKLFVEWPFLIFSCLMALFVYVAYVFVQVVEEARVVYQEHRVTDSDGSLELEDEERGGAEDPIRLQRKKNRKPSKSDETPNNIPQSSHRNLSKEEAAEDPRQVAPLLSGTSTSLSSEKTVLLNIFLGFQFTEATVLTFLPLSYSIIAAVFSCYTMILTKAVAGLVKLSITHDKSQFKNLLSLVLIFMLILFNVISECWKQKALSAYASVYVVTVFQVSLVIFSSIGGGLFYHEFDLGLFRGLMFGVGVLIVCIGIFCLSHQSNPIPTNVSTEVSPATTRETNPNRSSDSRRRSRRRDVSEHEEVEYTAHRSSPENRSLVPDPKTSHHTPIIPLKLEKDIFSTPWTGTHGDPPDSELQISGAYDAYDGYESGKANGNGNGSSSSIKVHPTETSPLLEHS